jgi:hypothetical protein
MEKDKRVSEMNAEELEDLIEKCVRKVLNEFYQNREPDFEDEELYGDNGGD